MWLFKKRRVIDLTKLSKEEIEARSGKKEELPLNGDYADFTQAGKTSSGDDSGNVLGFLGNMASSNSSPNSLHNPGKDVSHLSVKIEDIEYKLDNYSRKISAILDRLDLAEKKIDKLDRR